MKQTAIEQLKAKANEVGTYTFTQEQLDQLINNIAKHDRALKDTQVREKIGMSKSHMYRLMEAGKFPAPMRISERCVRWSEKAIDEWIEARQSEVK